MKFLCIIFALFLSVCAFAQQQIEITPAQFNFGKIKEENGAIKAKFTIKNISKKPYILNYSYSGCGCVLSKITKEPLMPNKSREIEVVFDPKGRPGLITKDLVLVSNNRKQQDKLPIRGEVIPRKKSVEELYPINTEEGLRLSDDKLPLGVVGVGENHTSFITVYNSSKKRMRLEASLADGALATVKIDTTTLGANRETMLHFTFNLADNEVYGEVKDTIILKVDGKIIPQKVLVNALAIYNIFNISDSERENAPIAILSPRKHTLSRGESINLEILNNGASNLKILDVVVEKGSADYKLSAREIAPKGKAKVSVTLKGDMASVSLLTNDPESPIITLTLKERVNL